MEWSYARYDDKLWMPTTPKEFEDMLNSRQIALHLKPLEDLADEIEKHYVTLQKKWEANTAQQQTELAENPNKE